MQLGIRAVGERWETSVFSYVWDSCDQGFVRSEMRCNRMVPRPEVEIVKLELVLELESVSVACSCGQSAVDILELAL